MRILLASSNRHKVKELGALLSEHTDVTLVTLKSFLSIPAPVEDGETFLANAVKKAAAYGKASGLLTIADDSGLCVDALNGAPGVRSARFAGDEQDAEANCRKLLEVLNTVPPAKRTARFECHIALAGPDEIIATVAGTVNGFITEAPRGRKGFGYDPLFLYPPMNKTFAEISENDKNLVSHRGQALRALKPVIDRLLGKRKKSLDN